MLDVAASAKAILAARPNARRALSRFLALDEPASTSLAVLVAALHDVGKFAASFQQKATGPQWPFSVPPDAELGTSAHDRDGLALWRQLLAGEFGPRILPDAERVLEWLLTASVGHHGRAVDPAHRDLRATFQPEGLDAARQCVGIVIDLLLPEPIRLLPSASRRMQAASFWFAGFVTIADWIGSGKEYFPYTSAELAPSEYWQRAQTQAARAVDALGLVSARPSGPREFEVLTGKSIPTPLQAFVADMDLGCGQVMIVIEDVTGAGKTEAAQVIVHRLMVAGRVAGAYWAMPTQATANAMYARQSQSIAALFADDASPQLALAHGGAALHGKFRESVLRYAGRRETGFGSSDDGETATAACAAFLADDARAALIADVGAGTVDQAILGVLPTRFQAVRLFGLSDKVLVIDEAHAYDSYVSEEVKGLLQFHAAMGGSAIVLSATLPRNVRDRAGREQLVRAWLEGSGNDIRSLRGRAVVQSDSYPLVTTVTQAGEIGEFPVETTTWSERRVAVRFVESDEAVVEAITHAARRGAAVAWIRNAVDDVLDAAGLLQGAGLDPVVFHSRFAQCDRHRIESEVMERLGVQSTDDQRRGTVVIATQVIEQSLDLDFDLMASDLAPVDLLIQRAGRLRRHKAREATRPDVDFAFIVRAPRYSDDPTAEWVSGSLRRTSFVYRDPAVLWRTQRALRASGEIVTPEGLRPLIEEVYASDAPVPEGLSSLSMRAYGDTLARAGQGRYNILSLNQGYQATQVAWVSEDRVQVRTRLGDAQTTLRLARCDGISGLSPWAEDQGPDWRRWSLSEVKVASHWAPSGSQPALEYLEAARAVRAAWGAREREREDILVLPLVKRDGYWTGTLVDPGGVGRRFAYDRDTGLRRIQE